MRIAAVLAMLSSCTTPNPNEDASVDAIELRMDVHRAMANGLHGPLDASNPLELFLGFQGFRYARVVIVSNDANVPAIMTGRSRLMIEGLEPIAQNYNQIMFGTAPGGESVSAPLMVFTNDVDLSAITGRRYTLEVNLRGPAQIATTRVSGTLYYNADCVDDGNGACIARDGGGDAWTDAAPDVGVDAPRDSSAGADASGGDP